MSRPRWAEARRRWLAAAAALAFSAGVNIPAAAACNGDERAYAGSDDGRVYALRFDACSGKLALLRDAAQVAKPRWITPHATLPRLYVAGEGDGGAGSVSAFEIEPGSGALKPLDTVASGGAGPTHLALDAASATLLVAHFGSGSTSSIALLPDGSLGARVSVVQATGSGPHRRQASAHAHGVAVDPGGRFVLVSDFGADRVFIDTFDRSTHALAASGDALRLPPGSGPRRVVFAPGGRQAYLLNELTAELMLLRWQAGTLAIVQTLPLSSAGFSGTPSASELAVSADGRYVYAADRGENTLVVFSADAASGALTVLQRVSAGGQAPWAFELHRSGAWLLLANQRSNGLRVFAVDAASGRLADTGQHIALPAPLAVAFVN